MHDIDLQSTLGAIVRHHPALAAVFAHLDIDTCCEGHLTLSAACARRDLDPATVVALLRALPGRAARPGPASSLGAICAHIAREHHAWYRAHLPGLPALYAEAVQCETAPAALLDTCTVVDAFATRVLAYCAEEETVLFPALEPLDHGTSGGPSLPALLTTLGTTRIAAPFDAAIIAEIRRLTEDYSPPPGACGGLIALYSRIETFETHLRDHAHLVRNVLLPTALETARRLAALPILAGA